MSNRLASRYPCTLTLVILLRLCSIPCTAAASFSSEGRVVSLPPRSRFSSFSSLALNLACSINSAARLAACRTSGSSALRLLRKAGGAWYVPKKVIGGGPRSRSWNVRSTAARTARRNGFDWMTARQSSAGP